MSNVTVDPRFLENDQMNTISIISLLTSGLSLLGSGSILICVVYHRRVCAPEVFPIFHLSVADGLASALMMLVNVTFLNNRMPCFPGTAGPCGYMIALMTSLYVSTFFLTLNYALEAFIRLRRRLQAYFSLEGTRHNGVSNILMYVVYFFSWTIPIGLAVVLMLVTHYIKEDDTELSYVLPMECSLCLPIFSAHPTYCWSHVSNGVQWLLVYRLTFLIPLAFVVILNMVLYICIGRDFRQVSMRRGLLSYHQRQEEATLRKKSFMYQTAFIVCWIPTMILEIAAFFDDYHTPDYFALFVLQAVLGPLQGLLNCIIYGWKRESFRRALTESSSLLSTSRPGGTMSFTL